MNKAIKEYRKRREKRLRARFDDDIQWISTETGSHIPLKKGVAAGGWAKGKKFEKATSVKREVKGTESPTHATSRKIGQIRRSDLSEHEQINKIGDLMKEAKVGTKIFFGIGGHVVGYQKTWKAGPGMSGSWKQIYGAQSIGGKVSGSDKRLDIQSTDNDEAMAVNLHKADYITSNSIKARKRFNEFFPRRSEYGTRESLGFGSDKELEGTYAKKLKGKELYSEVANDEYQMRRLQSDFEGMFPKKNGPKETHIEIDPEDPQKAFGIATYVSGRGKAKSVREERFKVNLSGEKVTKVNSKGEIASGPHSVELYIKRSFEKLSA